MAEMKVKKETVNAKQPNAYTKLQKTNRRPTKQQKQVIEN
jgi:hypothetical protein